MKNLPCYDCEVTFPQHMLKFGTMKTVFRRERLWPMIEGPAWFCNNCIEKAKEVTEKGHKFSFEENQPSITSVVIEGTEKQIELFREFLDCSLSDGEILVNSVDMRPIFTQTRDQLKGFQSIGK